MVDGCVTLMKRIDSAYGGASEGGAECDPEVTYASNQLLIMPDAIDVTLGDFMILIKANGAIFLVCMFLIGIRARPFHGEVHWDSCVPAFESARSTRSRMRLRRLYLVGRSGPHWKEPSGKKRANACWRGTLIRCECHHYR